ncbi:MAG: P1 family peptidase, partial [Acidobacteriota bacterium]
RELGIVIGDYPPGEYNAITDIEGVRVGHTTIIRNLVDASGKEKQIRTGVTAILPHEGNIYREHLVTAFFNQNGWGEMTGIAPLLEEGRLKTPIFLTGTYNVGLVYDAAVSHLLKECPGILEGRTIPSPVVAECFDGYLSDYQERMVTEADVLATIGRARGDFVEEGGVGGGTGMTAFGFKGGIGTSSRRLPEDKGGYTVGVLVMSNTAAREQLRVDGVPVGRELREEGKQAPAGAKSIILIAATDAPLFSFQLKKIAKRVVMGLAQTGATSNTGSGDLVLAFSTGNRLPAGAHSTGRQVTAVNDELITPLYHATVEATQEAILNSLTMARTMEGREGNIAPAIPLDRLVQIMKRYYRLEGKKND